jgi:hypothetical protein
MRAPSSPLTLLISGACSNPSRVRLRTLVQQGRCGVAARCPRLDRICRARGFVVEPTLELLISHTQKSRAPVAPTLTEPVSRPLVSNRTLQGSGFSRLGLGLCEGHAYSVRDQAI